MNEEYNVLVDNEVSKEDVGRAKDNSDVNDDKNIMSEKYSDIIILTIDWVFCDLNKNNSILLYRK